MKATLSKSAFAVTAILFGLVACADDADPPPAGTDGTDSGAPATTVPPASSTPAPTATSEAKCVSPCHSDSECESSCPAVSGGVQCCDLATNMCVPKAGSACPAPDDGGTTDPTPSY